MRKLSLIIVLFIAVSVSADSESEGTFSNLYCQTDFVIKQKLFDVKNAENTFEMLLDDPKKVNCGGILEKEKERIYKDLKERQEDNLTIDCNLKKLKELDFYKLRFKSNALLGLSLPIPQKNELRKKVNKEIEDAFSQAVDVC